MGGLNWLVSTGPSALKDNDPELNTGHRKPGLRPRTLVGAGETGTLGLGMVVETQGQRADQVIPGISKPSAWDGT